MELARATISKALLRRGLPDCELNIMTIQDALQWEDREDYDTLDDLFNSIVEDNTLVKASA